MRTQAPPVRRSIASWLCLVAVAAVLLGGCDTATGYVGTLLELQQAGIDNPSISNVDDEVNLEYDSTVPSAEVAEEENRAAEVIWRHLPLRFSTLTVHPRRALGVPRTYSREELEGRFGPRPSRLDKGQGDIERDMRDTMRNVVRGFLVGLVALVALVILVIVLVVRAARRRGPAAPLPGWPGAAAGPQPPWPQPPAQPGYPPTQPGQPGYPYPPPQPPWQPGAGTPYPPQAGWQPGPGQQGWQPPPAQPPWPPQQPQPTPPAPQTHEETTRLDQGDAEETRRIPRDPAQQPGAPQEDETRELRDGPTPPP